MRKDGFRTVTQSGLTLVVDQLARLDFVLEAGAVAESVEVTAVAQRSKAEPPHSARWPRRIQSSTCR